MKKAFFIVFVFVLASVPSAMAQELNAKVTINTTKLEGTKTDACESFRQKAEDFLNQHQWTSIKYLDKERLNCTFAITINKYTENDGAYECSLLLNCTRPVYDTSYQCILYSVQDNNFNFKFDQADQLEYNFDNLDNQLVALLAYYAHLLIGMDLDSFSPMGGTTVLQTAADIVTKAQDLGYNGWAAFNDNSNRYALLNDYIDPSMESMRQLNYRYHRLGLDMMADSSEVAQKNMFDCIELLDEARHGKNMSNVPQLFAEYKKTELVGVFEGKGTAEQRKRVYEILFATDPSLSTEWEKIKK